MESVSRALILNAKDERDLAGMASPSEDLGYAMAGFCEKQDEGNCDRCAGWITRVSGSPGPGLKLRLEASDPLCNVAIDLWLMRTILRYRNSSITASSTSLPGRVIESGSVASG